MEEKVYTFYCHYCNRVKSYNSTFSTGYATDPDGDKICYACCGAEDYYYMMENDRTTLYLCQEAGPHSRHYVSNWPGTFKRYVAIKSGRHNIAGVRHDVWFTVDGQTWHGVQYGHVWDSQICHCKKSKKLPPSLYLKEHGV